MGYGRVSSITLSKNDTITLVVEIEDFDEDTLVEISGSATQANGAVATFNSVKPADATIEVEAAIPPDTFVAGLAITVVARAAQVWITTLEAEMDPVAIARLGPHQDAAPPKAAWIVNNSGPAQYLPPRRPQSAQSQAAQQPEQPETAPPTTLVPHGTWWDRRKADPLYGVMEGRFTRLFPYVPTATFDECDLKKLACAMIAPEEPEQEVGDHPDPEENTAIPAAYTYLGQFIDHDLTYDPNSHLREALTPAQLQALVDFRTPRFDLDNLYGRGPDDQPYMYKDDGIHLLPGKPLSGKSFDPGAVDLPRGPSGRALIGDPRNDENRIVAQLHAIFLRFHNEVADRLIREKKKVSFKDVRDHVRWHYQWVLVDDFLRTILDEETYNSVFLDNYNFVTAIPRLRERDLELMPVEFSVAAYRFGHSMVRPRYQLNPKIKRPIFSRHPDDVIADLGGFRPIPANWAIDWQFFINLGHDAERDPQLSYKIDTSLVHPLSELPERVAKDPSSLALRNLQRGLTFQLPSGQEVARALGLRPLDDEELVIGKAIVQNPKPPSITDVAPSFAGNAPLWVYILSEAQVMSWKKPHPELDQDKVPIKLGPVGGRLVAEVFASLLRGDHTSYLRAEPAFEPRKDFTRDGKFGLAELINVALGHMS